MQVSVIIAVYNRAPLLPSLLEHWRIVDQATKYKYEIIFSDDESSDNSVAILEACNDLPVKVLKNQHGGAAKARNNAYQHATGDIIIFTGDDIFPEPNFINEHYESFLKNGSKTAMLGRIEWREGIQMNHLMKHITDIGCEQFGFVGMKPFEYVDFRHFYTSNISIARKELQELDCLFDQRFEKYGFEDIELGYRLYKRGVQILYNPNCLAYHDHVYSSVEKFCKRQLSAGEEMNTFKRLHPELSAEEIKVNIDEFNEKYERYVMSHKTIDFIGDSGRILVFLFKHFTKILEKFLANNNSYLVERLCSKLYSIVFSYYMYLGLAYGYDKCASAKPSQAKRYVFRYLFFGKTQVFYDKDNNFTEANSVVFHTAGEKNVTIEIDMRDKPKGRIRFDPLDHFCNIKLNFAQAHLSDGTVQAVTFDYSNGSLSGENRYSFSNENDPILISSFLPPDTKFIKIGFSLDYLLLKRFLRSLKNILRMLRKLPRKLLNYFEKRKNLKSNEFVLDQVDNSARRGVWVHVIVPEGQDAHNLLQNYQNICAVLPDVRIETYGSGSSVEYSEYIYKITDVEYALENTQFLNAILCLLEYDYDFAILSDSLDYYPIVSGYSIEDSVIEKKSLSRNDGEWNNSGDVVGRFIRLPGSRNLDRKIDLSGTMSNFKPQGSLIFNNELRTVHWNNDIGVRQVKKDKPIIFVLPVFMAVGGVEKNTIEIMNRIQDEFDFVVITFEPHRVEQGSLYSQVADKCLAYFDLAEISTFDHYIFNLEKLKEIYNPDLVWICNSSPWTMDNASNIRRVFNGVPIVVQDVYDYKYGWIEYYNRPAVHSYDRFIAINKKIESKFITSYGINPDDIDLVYSATDTKKIRTAINDNYSRPEILKSFNLDPDKLYFAFMGRFTEQKQPRKVFQLAQYITTRYENVDFVMVGDGEASADIERLIEGSGLKSRIHRIKYISNVSEFIKAIDGLVMVSLFEGLPIVCIEAMCVGTPIFSTDVGDIALFVNENSNGVITKSHEIEDIKGDFDRFYADLSQYKENAINCTEQSLEFFSSERAAGLMKKSFEKAMRKYNNSELEVGIGR
ncbi:glycosyltransferase [Paenibacillus sp. FSL W7-1279]|uniref:glycosyltransferase n=1 Tax=Paenibacillus sp. FSL W7-1279 TaxID=2921697 RepID=UPI0030DBBF3E